MSLSAAASATTVIPGSIGRPEIVDGYEQVMSVAKSVGAVTMPSVPREAGLPIEVVKSAVVPSADKVNVDVPQLPILKKRLLVVPSFLTAAGVTAGSAVKSKPKNFLVGSQ